ncbi:MAG: hypothetical protein ACLQBX_17675 [Candidatus Limnocylindrales bacterium]
MTSEAVKGGNWLPEQFSRAERAQLEAANGPWPDGHRHHDKEGVDDNAND